MNFVDVGIEKSIGESSKAISSFEDEISLKLIKMAKEANEAYRQQEQDVAIKMKEITDQATAGEGIQTTIVKSIVQKDKEEDKELEMYRRKMNELMEDFSVMKNSEVESELMKLQHSESFKKIKTDMPIYKQWEKVQDTQKLKNEQFLKDKEIKGTDETEEWEEKENQRLFKKEEEEEKNEIDLNIPKELGIRDPQIEKSGLFGMKKKLVVEYHDEESGKPDYLKYTPQERMKRQMIKIGECLSFVVILAIIYLISFYRT